MNKETMESSRQAEYQHHARQIIDGMKEAGGNYVILQQTDGEMTFCKKVPDKGHRNVINLNAPEAPFNLGEHLAKFDIKNADLSNGPYFKKLKDGDEVTFRVTKTEEE